ncbi:uncharacterized protein LOC126844595 [Adelges cooleyi]|uniref:uncharacterized protein LOC126844595 n=1 Tax=Adelges cooleyi TaxID=133065 RepID=UPI00217FC42F|nr:uncharacterized protein LOC126844595 [Adelges cooleyi]
MKLYVATFVVLNTFLLLLSTLSMASPLDSYSEDEVIITDDGGTMYVVDDYADKEMRNDVEYIYPALQKRKSSVYKYRKSCVPRGGNCDHRPKNCCDNGSCRCNLWGANCKCQRMGFFQKWGK